MVLGFEHETPDIRQALVADLAHSGLATAIMGFTVSLVSLFTWMQTSIGIVVVAAGCAGGIGTVAKLRLIAVQRHLGQDPPVDTDETRRWEVRHRAATLLVAASVALLSSALFSYPDNHWHVLATALLFAYCAGVVSRLSIRPMTAIAALLVSSLPVIVTAASWQDPAHRMTAAMFLIFMLGSFESVRHVHRRATRQIATRLDMASLVRRDPLTGLANRLGLRESFRSLIGKGAYVAVYCFDLDGFKRVNDQYGHSAGDALLAGIARRLIAMMPANTTVACLGGDEFAILQTDVSEKEDVAARAEAVAATLRAPFNVTGGVATIGISLGYVVVPTASADLDRLLQRADDLSYQAKRAGGNAVFGEFETPTATTPARRSSLRLVATR